MNKVYLCLIAGISLLVASSQVYAAPQSIPQVQSLFTTNGVGMAPSAEDDRVVKQRTTGLNLASLPANGEEVTLVLNLFNDLELFATVKVETESNGSRALVGQASDATGAYAGEVMAVITARGGVAGVFGLDTVINGNRLENVNVKQIIHEDEKHDDGLLVPEASSDSEQFVVKQVLTVDVELPVNNNAATPRADVLVLYTANALEEAGGVEAMQATVELSVLQANTSYVNSEVELEMNLVGLEEVNYTEFADNVLDISFLTGMEDGYMDEIHFWRNQLGADLVHLIKHHPESGCGVGWKPTSPITPESMANLWENDMFSLSKYQCTAGNKTFAHELGHNMGLGHDPENGGSGSYNFSFGYRVMPIFRTIMSYGSPTPRVLHFSNPEILFDGLVTGLETQNNALTLNLNAAGIVSARDIPEDPSIPVIIQEPAEQTVFYYEQASFSVVAEGVTEYYWTKNGEPLADSNSPTYVTPPAQFADDGAEYQCFAMNPFGIAASKTVMLTVLSPPLPVIIEEPEGQVVAEGAQATFSAVAENAADYYWLKNGQYLPNSNAPTYVTAPVQFPEDDGAEYQCFAVNVTGNTPCEAATLKVIPAAVKNPI